MYPLLKSIELTKLEPVTESRHCWREGAGQPESLIALFKKAVINNKTILVSEVCYFGYIFLFDQNSCSSISGVNLFIESMLFVMDQQAFDNFLLMKWCLAEGHANRGGVF